MSTQNSGRGSSPWLPVFGGASDRGTVAPSKPTVPTAPRLAPKPKPIDPDEGEVIAPVALPPQEEMLPWERPAAPRRAASLTGITHPPASALQPAGGGDRYRALGDAALRNASLSASGAPTPLGGVPRVTIDGAWFDDDFDGEHAAAAKSDDDAPIYTPLFDTGTIPLVPNEAPPETLELEQVAPQATATGDAHPPNPSQAAVATTDAAGPRASADTSRWRSVPVLVATGLIVMGGVAAGLYVLLDATLAADKRAELTPEVIVAPPQVAMLEPIAIENPTDFQAAMPGIVSTFALTGIGTSGPGTADLPVRAAEVTTLTYAEPALELTVRAIQHFDTEAALAQFEALAAESTEREPVRAGGEVVGERASIDGDEGAAIVWRNGTAVFELTGPVEALENFYAAFPL